MTRIPRLTVLSALLLAATAADTRVFHGPLFRMLRHIAADPADPPVARVCGTPVTRSQVDRAVRRLVATGTCASADSPGTRQLALQEVMDDILLARAADDAREPAAPAATVDDACTRFRNGFASEPEWLAALHSQGFTPATWRSHLAARLRLESFLQHQLPNVTRTEAAAWHKQHPAANTNPERIHLRHIFAASLDRTPDQAKQILEPILADIRSGKSSFPAAASHSEDLRSAPLGGDLGWIDRNHLPAEFTRAVFDLPAGKPQLVRSRLGWHLVEVIEHRAAQPRSFESAEAEILPALTAAAARNTIDAFRRSLRERNRENIGITGNP